MKTKTSTLQPPAAGLSSLLLGLALLLAMSVPLALRAADSFYLNNSRFDQGGFPGGAGYESIPGWGGGSGVNTSAGPFWDNGNLPDTTLVGFMQGNNLMGQSQGGLVVGQTYWIQAFVNARNGSDTPDLTVYHSASTVGGAALLSGQNIAPVGPGNPFLFVNVPFTAATASGDLNFRAVPHNGGDATMLIDGICVIARSTNDVVIANPSFEASGTGQSGVGVVNAVAGWNHTGANPSIINQAGGPYLDNGAVPEGNNVLVLQDDSAYSQTLHGLTPGQNYRLTLYLNSRGGTPATALVTIDGNTAYNAPVSQVGGSNPYHFISYDFTASATDVTLATSPMD